MDASRPANEDPMADACRRFAEIGGQTIRQMADRMEVRKKGKRDWVTSVDEAAQSAIAAAIAAQFPDSLLLGEEEEAAFMGLRSCSRSRFRLEQWQARHVPNPDDPLVWIVDPIDGTNNFIHGFPFYAVSVAVASGGTILAGAILDVCQGNCYWAGRETAACCDDRPIQSGDCVALDQAMVVGSIPRLFEKYPNCHEIFRQVSQRVQSVRRLGSAALNLAYVASGKLDSYWALSLQVWDVAAGVLILERAGGVQRIQADPISGGISYLGSCTPELQQQMSEILSESRPESGPAKAE